ncbi:MAG: ABC transporter substrate-binding protein, partial [Prevotellaceae bacterium]|nr:ABC transporter substrate-binding protein [Prevotellaceae bacterium]
FLGKSTSIVGVSGTAHLYDSLMQAACRNGRVAEVGYDTRLNVEKLLALQPNVVFAYGVSGEFSSVAAKLEEVGLRVVYIGEYTEQHPLGKTEWAVAMAAFWGCESEAIARFAEVEEVYIGLKKMVDTMPKVKALLNAPWGDAWYLPGAHGYAACLLNDAGGASAIPLREHRDSYPLSIEQACRKAQQATVWLNAGQAKNLHELQAMHKLVEEIPAFREGNVYNNNARLSPHGGSDFFDSGTVCPHLILKDIIKILHPQLLPDYTMTYYQKLKMKNEK